MSCHAEDSYAKPEHAEIFHCPYCVLMNFLSNVLQACWFIIILVFYVGYNTFQIPLTVMSNYAFD